MRNNIIIKRQGGKIIIAALTFIAVNCRVPNPLAQSKNISQIETIPHKRNEPPKNQDGKENQDSQQKPTKGKNETNEYTRHYKLLTKVLQRTVTTKTKNSIQSNVVNYPALISNPDFETVFQWFRTARIPENWAQKYAFWVNAYNVYTLKLMSEKMNGNSITKIDNGKAFQKKYYSIANTPISLDEIEKLKVKPLSPNGEFHFLLVCAALSCPDLPPYAYTPANIYGLQKRAAKRFFNNPTKGIQIDHKSRTVHISTLGKWYNNDFAKKGGFLQYASQFLEPDIAQKIDSYTIKYIPYNWEPNNL